MHSSQVQKSISIEIIELFVYLIYIDMDNYIVIYGIKECLSYSFVSLFRPKILFSVISEYLLRIIFQNLCSFNP